ncbi:MAG: homoserine O-acetyltransferase, partial [Limisphaerales bacterium]
MDEKEKSMLEGDLQDSVISKYHSDLGVTHTQKVKLPGFTTQSGYELKELEISYQTLGTLTPAKDNVVLVCHALSGDAHVAGINPKTGRPGWWDFHVGSGKSIDTNKFYVICSNVLGGCSGTTGP